MAEVGLTLEQKKALALAKARLAAQQQTPAPAAPPMPAPEMQQNPSPTPPAQAPGFMDIATSPNLAGGPLAMIGRAGMRKLDELIDKGAYGGGGKVTDIATNMGASPEVAGGLGTAANFGIRAIPSLVGAAAGKAAESGTKPVARALYQSALKPSPKDIASGDSAKAIETMLKGGFPASTSGVAKMRTIVRKLSDDVDDMIAATPGNVDKSAIRTEIIEQLKKFKNQANPKSDVQAILKSWDEFKETTGIGRNAPWYSVHGGDIPVQKAQALKQGTYKILADKYSHMGTVGDEAGTQAQMAIARGLRKGLEAKNPNVIDPNKKMAELINAIEIAERRAGIAGNRDIAGIAWLAENPAAAAGMLADRSPYIKSALARLLYSGMPTTGAATGTGAHLLMSEPERR